MTKRKTKKNRRRDVPEAALTLKAGEFGFSHDDAQGGVKLLARSSQPIDHWFWGRIVHDMAGVQHKERIVLDYNHDPDQVIGYLDGFEVTDEGLQATGQLVSFTDDDRAAEIQHKGSLGVPYEASINFGGSGLKLEEVSEGESVPVNGFEFDGPGVVVRSWPFRGCAVCPYGADENTESTVFKDGPLVAVDILTGETIMAEDTVTAEEENEVEEKTAEEVVEVVTEAVAEAHGALETVEEVITEALADEDEDEDEDEDDADSAEDSTEDSAEAKAEESSSTELSDEDPRSECGRFIQSFGADGGKWFAEGLSFAEAQDRHMVGVIEERDALREENETLRTQLAAVSRGEAEALDFSVAPGDGNSERMAKINGYKDQLGSIGAAAFAARFDNSKE